MAKKKKKQKKKSDYLVLPSLELNKQAQDSIAIIVLLGLGVISFLALFNLSGHFGLFIADQLSLLFGFGKWLFPLLLFYWAIILIRKNKRVLRFNDYLGLALLFISVQTIFHFFFYKQDAWKDIVSLGKGGGYTGLYLSQGTEYVFGFWGGVVFLIVIFIIAVLLTFNTSLSSIFHQGSYINKAINLFVVFFRNLFSSDEEEKVEEVEEEIDNDEEKEVVDEEIKKDWKKTEIIGEKKEARKKVLHTKQEKINWPQNKINIDLSLDLLNDGQGRALGGNINEKKEMIRHTLENFGIEVEMGETKVGPTVTQYTFKPAEGTRVAKIITLGNDLSLALAAHPIRIEAPIPGKSLVGIEVPNKAKAIVSLKEILNSSEFKNRKSNLMIALGKDVAGNAWLYDVNRMPHLLVAGATNSGKSVCLDSIIVSLLYQNNPDTLRFIMVDPKRVSLPVYNGIPHLLTPVITDVAKTINALKWCLNEMDRRYDLLNEKSKRDLHSYNLVADEKLPYIVFIIDELADFMMTSKREMEAAIVRLAQMSRAVGIHLILATQRPSVDVITGLIKANIPTRIAFSVSSLTDSRTILDMSGAEKLLGQGDMLFSSAEISKPKRIQGAFLSEQEIKRVVSYIKEKSGGAEYLEGVTDRQKVKGNAGVGLDGTTGDEDDLFEEAKQLVIKTRRASGSMLQRKLSVGYSRGAKILDMLEEAGVIGPSNGAKPREILISQEEYAGLSEQGISGVSLHSKEEASAPDSYLEDSEEYDHLDLSREDGKDESEEHYQEEEVEEQEEEVEEQEDQEENKEDPKEEIKEEKKKETKEDKKEDTQAIVDEDDEMFFSY